MKMVEKPNQKPLAALHKPISAVGQPFIRVHLDCVGLLPISKSKNQFLLSSMHTSTCIVSRNSVAINH